MANSPASKSSLLFSCTLTRQVGDEITTIGGICGRIVAVKDETDSIVIETGSDKAKLRVKRWAIGSVDTVHEDDQN